MTDIINKVVRLAYIKALTVIIGMSAFAPLTFAEETDTEVRIEVRDATRGFPEAGAMCTFFFMPSYAIVGPVIADSDGVSIASTVPTDTWFDVNCVDQKGGGMGGKSGFGLTAHDTTVLVVLTS
jgi:hypothetical protein